MIDLENLFQNIEITSPSNKTRACRQGIIDLGDRGEAFKSIFQDRFESSIPAKSGNISPPDGAHHEAAERRSLNGGSELILGGAEPTEDSIAEFAAMQGIDPQVMAMIMGESWDAKSDIGSIAEGSTLEGSLTSISTALLGQNTTEEVRSQVSQGTLSQLSNNGHGLGSLSKGVALDPSTALASQNGAKDGEKIQASRVLPQDYLGQVDNGGIGRKPLREEAVFTLSGKKTIQQPGKIDNKNLFKNQEAIPSTKLYKLEPINLGSDSVEILSDLYRRGSGGHIIGTGAAFRLDAQAGLVVNQSPDLRADMTAKSLAEAQNNTDQDQLIRRQEHYLEVSRRLTEALGERLTAQITKGAWRVEMDLHPKSLGRIEIHLEMKNGDLEAYFNASQNGTRELLQESFSKLKDILAEHGIDSAYVGLGSGKKQNSDGNPTDEMLAAQEEGSAKIDLENKQLRPAYGHLSSSGLDVQV